MTTERIRARLSGFAPVAFFLAICGASFFAQGIGWAERGIIDNGMWGHEAEYLLAGDTRAYDFLLAYGHPGGPIIEGTVALHHVFGLSFDRSVILTISFLISLATAGACSIALLLRPRTGWWIPVGATIALDWLYFYSTPPSAVAAALIAFLSLITLYLFENGRQSRLAMLALWALIAGASIAARADIGGLVSLAFLLSLVHVIDWKKSAMLAGGALLSFVAFDPFMWFMPAQHVADLVHKAAYHYAEFATHRVDPFSLLAISALAAVSLLLAIASLLLRKRVIPPVAPAFIGMLVILTGALYAIFLTSHYQAERYFLPVVFIWELLLPLFLFSLAENVEFSFLRTVGGRMRARKLFRAAIIVLLVAYQVSFLLRPVDVSGLLQFIP